MNVSYGSAQRAMKELLSLTPYKISVLQEELKPTDFEKQVKFCNWMQNLIENRPNVFESIVFPTKHIFTKAVTLIAKIIVFGVQKTLIIFMKQHFKRNRIVGPLFFNHNLNSEGYIQIIRDFIAQLEYSERLCWLQQDGAPCHTASSTLIEKRHIKFKYGHI